MFNKRAMVNVAPPCFLAKIGTQVSRLLSDLDFGMDGREVSLPILWEYGVLSEGEGFRG